MLKPYVYIQTNKSRDVRREAPDFTRLAYHHPELGRTLELCIAPNGTWSIAEGPAPGGDGDFTTIASGKLEG